MLCEHALINTFADQQRTVTVAHVEGVAREFELDSTKPTAPSSRVVDPQSLSAVEIVLRDLSTVLEQMRQPASLAIGSTREAYEPYS